MKKWLTITAAILFVAGSYAAALEDWQFNDDNGTALNTVTNAGTVGTSWNFGGPQTQAGNLNIGATEYYKWDVGLGVTYRTAAFPEITNGVVIFQYTIADWDLGGSDGVGDPNNGIKFNFGHTTNGSAQLEFEVAQSPGTDIRVRSQNSNNGNLSGTDAQHQLGGLNLTNTASVVVTLVADLDTGEWSTSAEYNGNVANLVTDGTGMFMIDRIQLLIDGSNGAGWEYIGTPGTAAEFVMIDSVTLSVPDTYTKLEYWNFDLDAANKSFGTNWINSGFLNSEWSFGGPAEIATDGAGSLVVSNHPGETFRKLPKAGTANADAGTHAYAVPFTSGVYRLEMDFSSWNLPDGNGSGNLQFQVASDNSAVASIQLRVSTAGDAAWIQLMGKESGALKYNTYGLGADSTNKTTATSAAIELDLDNNTIEYFINGVLKKSTNTFNEAGFNQVIFTTDATWSSNNVVTIDAMGLSQLGEPDGPPPGPFSITEIQLISGNTQVQLTMNGLAIGQDYRIRDSVDLATGFSDVAGSQFTATNDTSHVEVISTDVSADPNRFFQAIVVP